MMTRTQVRVQTSRKMGPTTMNAKGCKRPDGGATNEQPKTQKRPFDLGAAARTPDPTRRAESGPMHVRQWSCDILTKQPTEIGAGGDEGVIRPSLKMQNRLIWRR